VRSFLGAARCVVVQGGLRALVPCSFCAASDLFFKRLSNSNTLRCSSMEHGGGILVRGQPRDAEPLHYTHMHGEVPNSNRP
jgi:hypothetical protein